MNRTRTAAVLLAGGLLTSAASLTADVRTEQKTLVRFEGMLATALDRAADVSIPAGFKENK